MRWKNIDTGKIINNRRYGRLSDEDKKNWEQFDENIVEHGDIINVIGGGLIGEDSEKDDDD